MLTQSELYSLSLLSSPSPSSSSSQDDVVVPIPKIDRSVFNESAGSRKQTYFRLRLAPRTTANPPHASAPISRQRTAEPFEEENSRIISLLKGLFGPNAEPEPRLPSSPEDETSLIAVTVRYDESVPESSDSVLHSIPIDVVDFGGFSNRKRGRPRKLETCLANVESPSKERERTPEVGDLDLFEEELRLRTAGMRTEFELSEFLRGLSGEWGSRRKKRKIVDARSFGDALPPGWKLLLSIKNDGDRAWLGCNRYISPDGQQFISSEDVWAHLFPAAVVQDAVHNVAQDMSGPGNESSGLACKMASENSTDAAFKMGQKQNEAICLSAVPISSIPADAQMQSTLPASGNPGKYHLKETYGCHKCTLTFEEKDDLLLHLLSSHKKARSARNGATNGDSVIMKDGKYECQLCHKLFEEKNRYSSHFGNHIKDYVKRVEASGETNRVQKRNPRMHDSVGTRRVSTAVPINTDANGSRSYDFPSVQIAADSQSTPKVQQGSEGDFVNTQPNDPTAVLERNEDYVPDHIDNEERDSGFLKNAVGVNDEVKEMITESSSPPDDCAAEIPEKDDLIGNENKLSMDSVSLIQEIRQETLPVDAVCAASENNNAIDIENNESLVNRLFGSPMEDMDVDDGDELGDNVLMSGIEDRCFGLEEGVLNNEMQKSSGEGGLSDRLGRDENVIHSGGLTGTQTSVLENGVPESRLPSSGRVVSPYNSWNGKKPIDFSKNVTEGMAVEANASFPVIPAANQATCDFDENVKAFPRSNLQNPWPQQAKESDLLSIQQKPLSPDAHVGKVSDGLRNFQALSESRPASSANQRQQVFESAISPVHQKSLSPDTSAGKISSGTVRNFQSLFESQSNPTVHQQQFFESNLLSVHQKPPDTSNGNMSSGALRNLQPPSENRSDSSGLSHADKETSSGGGFPVTSPNQQAYAFNTHAARGPIFGDPKEYRGFTGLYAGDLNRGNPSLSGSEEKQMRGGSVSSIWSSSKSSLGIDNRYPLQHGGPVMGFEAWANPPSRPGELVTPEPRGATFFGSGIEQPKHSKQSAFGLLSPSVGHQQAAGGGYNLDMFYGGSMPDNRRPGIAGNLRNNEQATGFYNHQPPKPLEEPMAQPLWRMEQSANMAQNSGLNYVTQTVPQPQDCFPAFNMVPDKVQNEFYASNQKLGNAHGLGGGMRSGGGGGGFMEYNFLSAPSSGQGADISSSFSQQIPQSFESNWVEKEALGLFPKIGGSSSSHGGSRQHQVTAICMWCGNQFSHDGNFDTGDGSVGYMCFNCKGKFAGQINFF